MYIILYNIHDSKCLQWIEEHAPSDVRLVDWYRDQEDWIANGGTTYISAFPTVITPSGVVVTTPSDWNEVVAAEVPPGWSLVDGVWTAPPVKPLP